MIPQRKKVLIVTYLFPPEVGGVSVLRVVKFIKWLKRLGWEPIVLTVKRLDTITPDPTLLKEIDGVKIYRCNDYFRGFIRYALIKLGNVKNMSLGIASTASREVKTVRYGLIKKILYDLICIPDECFGWIMPAIINGRKIIKREGISIIITTSPPFSSHFIGYILKKMCRTSLVLDFRDRWVGHPHFGSYTLFWRRNINRWLEKVIVNGSDRVITVTEGLAKYFKDAYASDKVSLIFNGYDEDDFNFEIPVRRNKDKLIFSHVGSIGNDGVLQYLISALEGMSEEVLKDIEVNFVGKLVNENEIKGKPGKAVKCIKILGFHPYKDALKMMFLSDVLVVMVSLKRDGYNALGVKIFEYIRTAKPVFAICPRNSELWNFVNKYGLGICADSTDVEGIRKAITFIHKKWKDGSLSYNPSLLELGKFDRKRHAQQLIEIFEQISSDTTTIQPVTMNDRAGRINR